MELTEEQYKKASEMDLTLAMLWAGAGEWYNGMTDGAKSECEKMGIEIVTTADAEFDPAQQATQIETALSLNPDIMLTLPVDPVSGTTAYQPAVDAGVKIVFADNSVNDYVGGEQYVAVCTGDQYGMGRTCADLIAESIGGAGKIGIIYYDSDYTVTNNRDNQFVRSILEDYPDIEIASMMGFAEETATGEVASAMLTQNRIWMQFMYPGMWQQNRLLLKFVPQVMIQSLLPLTLEETMILRWQQMALYMANQQICRTRLVQLW